jgi:hypothetical protein
MGSPWALGTLGVAQLALWCIIAWLAADFTPGGDFARRPMPLVVSLLAANFLLYLASLALVWSVREEPGWRRHLPAVVVAFAVVFRLPLWWSQPIQEIDIYRYLWDGRVFHAGVNPYRYSPAQVDAALAAQPTAPELDPLVAKLHRSRPVHEIFARIEHRSVATIYPPLSQAVFAAAAWLTPENAPVLMQVRVLKGILLAFDLAVLGFVMGLLRNLGLPVTRALAYGWCPLILKEFANSGHLDSIAVCFTTATLWLLTLRRGEAGESSKLQLPLRRVLPTDWLAVTAWACATLAKLYPLVLAPLLLVYGWRRLRWRMVFPAALFVTLLLAGYAALPRTSSAQAAPGLHPVAAASTTTPALPGHSSFSGLGEFLRRWEINDLLFSVVYENLRPAFGTDNSPPRPWYVVLPGNVRASVSHGLRTIARRIGPEFIQLNLPFVFTQVLMGVTLLGLVVWMAQWRWPEDGRQELLRRAFLSLAWLWFLSATQNPWYWSWALPFVVFASRPWLLVSGLALIYYLRFWFVYHFPNPATLGGLTGQRFFDEVLVWVEHLPVLLILAWSCVHRRDILRLRTIDSTANPVPPSNRWGASARLEELQSK